MEVVVTMCFPERPNQQISKSRVNKLHPSSLYLSAYRRFRSIYILSKAVNIVWPIQQDWFSSVSRARKRNKIKTTREVEVTQLVENVICP